MRAIAFLDCSMGVSGEMLLGALLASGFESEAFHELVMALPLPTCNYSSSSVHTHAERGLRFSIASATLPRPAPRHLADIEKLLRVDMLSAAVREKSFAVFQCLAHGIAKNQGCSAEAVTFASSKLAKMFVEVVSIVYALETMNIDQFYISTLPLMVGAQMPDKKSVSIPDPVALEILSSVQAVMRPQEESMAFITPVAAALLATLGRFEQPEFTVEQVGYGYAPKKGNLEPCLRLYKGKLIDSVPVSAEAETDQVTVIETHIDNMSGELLGGLMERLLTLGALDVSYAPIQMKKNRPATRVTVICQMDDEERFALLLLRETTTLGVRMQRMQRLKAHRSQQRIETPLGAILVKVKSLGGQVVSAAPEYEECQRIAREQNRPLSEVYEVAHRAIQALIIENRE